MKFSIRKANIKSAKTVAIIMRLQKATLPYDKPYEPKSGAWFIAYAEDGEPAAFAGIVQSNQWTDTAYLCRAGVLTKYTGHGLQARLIKARLRAAKAMGYVHAITDTTTNPASSNSLINAGFKLYEPSRPHAYAHSLYWRIKV